ncbi:MAG: transcriptional regulator [Planctomycetes bacterium]|nr:transcriptional regulator [Planctomycetota bacterium]
MSLDALDRAQQTFVRRWGEMGATWGISRTMAEVHALLFITGDPLCTDNIMQMLQISRGNASMNLRQLVNWGLIRRTHLRGDRKEYFVSDLDTWQMFETITRERRRREVGPIIDTLKQCRSDLEVDAPRLAKDRQEKATECDKKLADMLDFINTLDVMLDAVLSSGSEQIGTLSAAISRAVD